MGPVESMPEGIVAAENKKAFHGGLVLPWELG